MSKPITYRLSGRKRLEREINVSESRSYPATKPRVQHGDLLCGSAVVFAAVDSPCSTASDSRSDPASAFNAPFGNDVPDPRRNVSGIATGIRVSGRVRRFDHRDHRICRDSIGVTRLWFGQADRLDIQHFRHSRFDRGNYNRDDLQRAGRDGTGILGPGRGGAAIIGDSVLTTWQAKDFARMAICR